MIHFEKNKAQRDDEFRQYLQLLLDENIRSYLEVGVQRGITFRCSGLTMAPGARMVGVDMPGGPWGVKDGTGPDLIKTSMARLRQHGQKVDMLWGNSTDQLIIDAVTLYGPYDCVFIDADHSYEGVKADWENYGKLGRVVVFHDIDTENKPRIKASSLAKYGVHTLWRELRDQYRHVEFIGHDRGMGIGVLWRT